EGNELHPITAGTASAQMQAAVLGLYDPDRSPHPLQKSAPGKSGEKGEKGEKKTWADFVAVWKAGEGAYLASGGEGLAVLASPSASPTLFRLAGQLRQRFPNVRWATWEPVSEENALAGAALLAGRPLRPVYDLAAARVVVSLDADLLLTESDAVAHARGFVAGRRLASEKEEMNRLWVVESAFTTTGAMADHRLALPSSRIGAFALALGNALAAAGVPVALPAASAGELPGVPPRWLAALAKDLAANPGRGLVAAGREQPPAVHALALALNAALGNVGTTVLLREPVDVIPASTPALSALAAAMRAGAVSNLIILGGNPAYDAPADLQLAGAIAKVKNVVHLGQSVDETAALAHWHLPEAHFLEAWGDCRSSDGTVSVVQPLIEPLFGGRSAVELLGLLASGEDKPGHDLVRETWTALLPAGAAPAVATPTVPASNAAAPNAAAPTASATTAAAPAAAAPPAAAPAAAPAVAAPAAAPPVSDDAWNKVLHDGLLAGSALPPAATGLAALPPQALAQLAAPAAAGLELVFRPSPAVHDGRFANVSWLQELPDAVTKLTWGNAALLAPKTAERLGLANEDGVRLKLGAGPKAEVELPVWIVPGQAEDTVVVHLGYGRRAAGRAGTGVGADVYPLRTRGAMGFAPGASLERSGTRYELAQTQDHGSMEGRPVIREASLAEWRAEPRFAAEMVEVPKSGPLWEQHRYEQGPQWAMAIDLNACTGCNACVIACQSENNVPVVGHEQVRKGREMHWLRIDRYFSGAPEHAEMVFQPMPCQQCENAPCEQVCPVAATVHTEDGLNAMVYNRCIGTRYCSNNCPYKVRRFNFFNFTKDTPELVKMAANPDVTVRARGVMEKCTYCVQRIQAARIDAKMAERPLADGDVRTACQQTCPTQAIIFGDLRDPKALVNARKANSRDYVLLAELGNKPRTSYLARIRNPHPDLVETPAEPARHAAPAAHTEG
ncbi:MAG TPA: 4Fe-4S dicluster domain-containing protein, partial [Thermoanaerobaculia bacterium]|nr:4Fe-4S dicluster domain-containing protein [Thermoanaerobaculia bacterium]